MTTRILPPDEWPKLAGTEAEYVWPYLDPLKSRVVVIEDDGAIIGCHILMNVLHAECLWIREDHRGKSSVARRLWTAVQTEAKAMGAQAFSTSSMSDDIDRLLEHVGAVKVPGKYYSVRLH